MACLPPRSGPPTSTARGAGQGDPADLTAFERGCDPGLLPKMADADVQRAMEQLAVASGERRQTGEAGLQSAS
jgi:hypothetical protein